MKFRTRVLCLFVGMALLTNSVLFAISYWQSSRSIKQQIESAVLSIASTGALGIDGERLLELVQGGEQDSDAYRDLEAELRHLRNTNRRSDLQVRFVYTLHRDPSRPDRTIFGVDAEEPGPDKSDLRSVYQSDYKFVFNGDAPYVFPDFVTDEWGTWITAQAPIRTSGGEVAGLLGVDVDARDVVAASRRFLVTGLLAILTALLLAMLLSGFLSTRISLPLAKIHDAVRQIGKGRFETEVRIDSRDEFGEVADAVNDMALGLMQRENLKGALASYVSRDVTQAVLDEGTAPQIAGERRRITVLFADLRGFTRVSDRAPPERVVAMLNQFYERMIEAVLNGHGFLNKFLGDGLMAVFGAPRSDDRQELHAVEAAFRMLKAQDALRERWVREGVRFSQEELRIGIGIYTGDAIVGNVGSDERMEYTAIGDTVNVASRLESMTKEIGAPMLIGTATYTAVKDVIPFYRVGPVSIRGKELPVEVFAPVGLSNQTGFASTSSSTTAGAQPSLLK